MSSFRVSQHQNNKTAIQDSKEGHIGLTANPTCQRYGHRSCANQIHVGQTAPTKDNAENEHEICCHTEKDVLLTKENLGLATKEGEGEIPELMNKIFKHILDLCRLVDPH